MTTARTIPSDTESPLGTEDLQAWYREIAVAHYNDIFRYCRSLTFTEADALDLTQNAFLKLGQQLSKIRDRGNIKRWLLSVAYREFVDGYRHRKRFPKMSIDAEPEPTARMGTTDPHTSLDAESALAALHHLPGQYRAPLALFYLEDLSYKDIADTLGIPIGTVMSRLRRGKDRLRVSLEGAETRDPRINGVSASAVR